MLTLGRRVGESLVIGEGKDEVLVTVTYVGRGQVKLGVTAPQHISVDREEIRERKRSGNWVEKQLIVQ